VHDFGFDLLFTVPWMRIHYSGTQVLLAWYGLYGDY
jgi:hypothetical protein